jgi:signal transduction histidine kinase
VTVSVRASTPMHELTVSDAGRGIPPEERERVFERFYRVPGDSTAGSGLGLSIVRAIVERHGGTISLADARAEEPRGLAVHVRLPALAARAATSTGDRETPPTALLPRRRMAG